MIRHIVLYKFAEKFTAEENEANARRFKRDIENLRGVIDDIVEISVEIEMLPNATADIALNSLFRDAEGLERYKNHPEHMKIAEFVKQSFVGRLCADFEED